MQGGKVIVRNETPYQIQATVYEVAGGDPVEGIGLTQAPRPDPATRCSPTAGG